MNIKYNFKGDTQLNRTNNVFEIEKLYSRPGIYIIYNKLKNTAYIGQSADMKERMHQHLDALYNHKHIKKLDNKNLKKEFAEGNNIYFYRSLYDQFSFQNSADLKNQLDQAESLFFQAAQLVFGKENIHNTINLTNIYTPSENELTVSMLKVKNVIHTVKTPIIKIDNTTKRRINQDILGTDIESIINSAFARKQVNNNVEITFEKVSIKKLYEQGKLNHIILGKMGDYIGSTFNQPNDHVQSFTDIIIEKLACISDFGKCLWTATSSPIDEINTFIHNYGFGKEEKKVYALFALTSSKYDSQKKLEAIYHHKNTGLEDTVPVATLPGNRTKALIINKLMPVSEDFDFNEFSKMYYRHSAPGFRSQQQKYEKNSELCSCTRLPATIVTRKDIILSTDSLQKELFIDRFDSNEMDNFKNSIPRSKIIFDDTEPATYYILAEVSAADWIYPKY